MRADTCPACLVLDIKTPGSQWSGTAARARCGAADHSPGSDIPMTVDAMKAGASDFLPKPVRDADLLSCDRAGARARPANARTPR